MYCKKILSILFAAHTQVLFEIVVIHTIECEAIYIMFAYIE